MTIKQVMKLNVDYSSSPYIFYTYGDYPINGAYYAGIFIYTTLTDYPQLNTSGSSGNLPGDVR